MRKLHGMALLAGVLAGVPAGATAHNPAVGLNYQRVAGAPIVRKVLDDLKADDARALAELRTITEIPAPPFKEEARAAYFLARLRELGLADAHIDREGNVVGVRKGSGGGPRLLLAAHLDTVFPEGTDVRVKERDGRLYAPGIADDTRGLAVLLSWLKALNDNRVETVGDLMFVGSVGEEGLGDLRGMKALFRDHRDIDGMVGLEPAGRPPGRPDEITTTGTASHRYQFHFKGPGGHSFEAFGLPSAIHAMGRAVAGIGEVRTPERPKTSFTVGTASGGTSVNTIAAEARIAVDIRSNGMPELLEAERRILAAVREAVAEENRRWNSDRVSVETTALGERPGGATPGDAVIVQAFVQAITGYGRAAPAFATHSTDANVPMSLGIPAVIISSAAQAGEYHTLNEWIDPRDGWQEAQIGMLGVLSLVGIEGVSAPLLERRKR
ncbi:M20/M25/M40 family metallo-hydrolase [Pseudoduganella namucuonensis]|uniref:Acetylornithine deacetylase/Succinyl-diaminopimelate desuccinylase n=1 Tax=Pseudoduganella namucuonensis TaxID=1035707 RepID=A0A1I7LZS7_9BURK|nr:M20/M25/M40 family metallo-hydrolase [Pseudoduganella namucuonensis]SFV15060.1 Acetylornithine deacetylase/Succinyl-diaminopimelate desuccinylase [Pseudoduganella namucuonensis]